MTKPIIMHQTTKTQLESLLASQNLNSVGFHGQNGAGKSHLAKYFLQNALQIQDCETNPYVKIVDCSQDAGIEQIRGLKTFLQLKVPSRNQYSRCIVIENIEILGIPAQNALLKMLEEPPQATIMVVSSANKNAILPTIISRLQWINVLPLAKSQLDDNQFSDFDKTKLDRAFLLSEGKVGMLLSLLNDPQSHADFLAAIDEAKNLIRSDRFEKLARIDWLLKNEKYSLDQLLQAMAKVLKSVLTNKPGSPSSQDLVKKLDAVLAARESLKYNPSRKLLLTTLFNKL